MEAQPADSTTEAPADFSADTAIERLDGAWSARVEDAWSGPPGPNGGYVAALILRAIRAEVDDPTRHPRSLVVHFMRPPATGEVRVEVTIERTGRSASTCTARMLQGGKTTCLALCTLAGSFESAIDFHQPMPEVPPPGELEPLDPGLLPPKLFRQLETRLTFGELPFTGAEQALVGGWLRTRVPAPLDPELIALYTDACWPAPFAPMDGPMIAPTLDLTIHFRAISPSSEERYVLGRFVSRTAVEGYFEEDGELWTPDGTLIAQSRQLALARPLADGWDLGS